MSGLLNELDSYREVTRAIATQGRSLGMEKDQESYQSYYSWMIQIGLRPLEYHAWLKLQKQKGGE